MKFTESVRSFHVPAIAGHVGRPPVVLRTYFARHARDLAANEFELIHHRVDGVLQLEHLALRFDVISVTDRRWPRRRHERDVAHLTRQVAGHEVHAVSQILPRARDTGRRLTTQIPSVPTSRATRATRRRIIELVHMVSRCSQLEDLSLRLCRDLRDRSPFSTAVVTSALHLRRQVRRHEVHES